MELLIARLGWWFQDAKAQAMLLMFCGWNWEPRLTTCRGNAQASASYHSPDAQPSALARTPDPRSGKDGPRRSSCEHGPRHLIWVAT